MNENFNNNIEKRFFNHSDYLKDRDKKKEIEYCLRKLETILNSQK